MENKIKTLAQLQKEKKKLKLQMEVSKHEFVQGANNTKEEGVSFLINKVAIPLAILGFAGFGIIQWQRSKKKTKKGVKATDEMSDEAVGARPSKKQALFDWQKLIMQFLPLGIQLLQTYLFAGTDKEEDMED